MGLKKWIDQQLHPDRIPENPVLLEKLKTFDTPDHVERASWCATIRRRRSCSRWWPGQMPFPTDPDRRMMIQKLVKRDEAKQGDGDAAASRRARPAGAGRPC